MAAVAIAGDLAGGAMGSTQTVLRVNGTPVVVLGDPVAGHGEGAHAGPTMAEGSSVFRVNGDKVVRTGDLATCAHAAIGSSHLSSD